jgi:ammonia channel protein AmtB
MECRWFLHRCHCRVSSRRRCPSHTLALGLTSSTLPHSLVAITPAAGFVGTPAAALIGLVAGACSNLATRLKVSMRVDDPMDVFAVHALAGAIGTFMTGM